MKVFKVLMYFTPTSDPHAPFYFLDETNIEPYIGHYKNDYPQFSYTIQEEDYNTIESIPIYPRDGSLRTTD